VTQATLSRDLREIGIEKIDDELGLPRYVLRERPAGPDPRAALAAILGRFGRGVAAAQNIVVIRSELGSAPAIARALHRVRHPLVVGTLAGDDT
jgi:transcriptional regulator of arginine metabolism